MEMLKKIACDKDSDYYEQWIALKTIFGSGYKFNNDVLQKIYKKIESENKSKIYKIYIKREPI
ncbi:MAG: hypothetical protein N2Z20_02815 [Elusimicrobiales bacterium]|nr:hypothetical protein [Elusimicrobiales bacterium]